MNTPVPHVIQRQSTHRMPFPVLTCHGIIRVSGRVLVIISHRVLDSYFLPYNCYVFCTHLINSLFYNLMTEDLGFEFCVYFYIEEQSRVQRLACSSNCRCWPYYLTASKKVAYEEMTAWDSFKSSKCFFLRLFAIYRPRSYRHHYSSLLKWDAVPY